MNVKALLQEAIDKKASDVFFVPGLPVSARIGCKIVRFDTEPLQPDDTNDALVQIYQMAGHRSMSRFVTFGDDDFSFSVQGMSRFRVSAFKQRGSLSAVVRIIAFRLPDHRVLGIPSEVMNLCDCSKGLILVTGPAGSGKSTTLACMIDYINKHYQKHIITLEDPLEFLHKHEQSIVSQREISADTENYVTALRAALRQSPDVILLGEMRDYETIQIAMTAAETGHLVLSTLHTIGSSNTINRIIDAFPPNQQRQIAIQLSMVLKAVVSQQLVPTKTGRLVPAFEIMTVNQAIRNMIRENKVPQIDGMVYSGAGQDMMSMDSSLSRLYHEGLISKDTALTHASNPDMLSKRLS